MDNTITEFNINGKDFMTSVKEAIGWNPIEVKFKKLDPRAVIPSYAHNGDVGMDMTAIDVEYNAELDLYIYHTGLAFESDFHFGQLLFPRSSNRKTDAYLCNSVGIADSAIYRGEILFCFKNREPIQSLAHRTAMEAYTHFLAQLKHNDTMMFMEALKVYDNIYYEVLKNAKNLEYAPYKVGDRIGQMVIINYPDVILTEQEELQDSERGANGFGSTGN